MPLVFWGLAVAGVVALWEGRTTRVDGQGMFDGRRAAVGTNASTRIRTLHVVLGQRVSAMEVLVELDDAEVQAELKVAESELVRLEADLQAARVVLEMDEAERKQAEADRLVGQLSSDRNYAVRVERLRLDKLDRTVQLATDEVEVQRLAASYERSRKLHAGGVVGDEELDLIRFEYEAMKRKVEASKEALAIVEGELKAALARKAEFVTQPVVNRQEVALAPLRQAMQVQRDRVEQIRVRLREYTIRAPFGGVVAMIRSYEGQEVRAGDTVLTVVDPEPIRIVGFLQPGKPVRPYPGMPVEVRRRTTPIQVTRAKVLQVGAEVELIPPQVTGNTTMPMWGTRVLIELPLSMAPDNPTAVALGHTPPKLGEPVDIRYIVATGSSE